MTDDDRLITWLEDHGYEYDFDKKEYIDRATMTSVKDKEEQLRTAIEMGAKPTGRDARVAPERFEGLRRAVFEREPKRGSILYELKNSDKKVDEVINRIASQRDLTRLKSSEVVNRAYSPEGIRLKRADEIAQSRVARLAELKLNRLKTEFATHKQEIIKNKFFPTDLEEAKRRLEESTTDTQTIKNLLKPTIAKTQTEILRNARLRNLANTLTKRQLRLLKINTVSAFAKTYGWDKKNPGHLEQARRVLEAKGVRFVGKRDKFGNEIFEP